MEDIKQQLDVFLDQFTGKHNDDLLYATLFEDTVKVRKDIILNKVDELLSLAVKQERELSYKKGYSDGFNSRMI